MADFEGKTIATTYKSVLNVGPGVAQILDDTPRVISDGAGNLSKLYLSLDSVLISGSGTKLNFYDDDATPNGEWISADSGGKLTINAQNSINLMNANVGIGTADPGASLEIKGASQLRLANPEGSHYSEIIFNNTEDLIFSNSVSGVGELMRITSAGNVGIGTDSPGGLLHLKDTTGGNAEVKFTLSGADSSIQFTNSENVWSVGADDSKDLFVIADGTSLSSGVRLAIDNTGNVGIGTATPDCLLSIGVIENSGNEGNFEVKSDSNHHAISIEENSGTERWSIGVNAAGNLGFHDSGTSTADVVFECGGNVGIGTDSPGAKLEVNLDGGESIKMSSGSALPFLRMQNQIGSSSGKFSIELQGTNYSNNYLQLGRDDGGHDIVLTGRVGIGTIDPGADLEVASSTGNAVIEITANDGSNSQLLFSEESHSQWALDHISSGAYATQGDFRVYDYSDSSVAAHLSPGDGVWQSGSDERIKKDIENIDSVLGGINSLRPITWKRKYGKLGKVYAGLVAQEVIPHFPLVISGTEDSFKELPAKNAIVGVAGVTAVEAASAKDAVMGERQKVVVTEVEEEQISTEIVLEGGKYIQKTTTKTVTKEVLTPQYEEVKLYDEDGEEIGTHQIPVMEGYEVESAVVAVEAVEAVEAIQAQEATSLSYSGGLSIGYSNFVPYLIKAIQELSAKVTALENE